MKIALVFLVAIALACAAPQAPAGQVIQILKSAHNQDASGSYTYNFETENNIVRDEVGELKTVKDEEGKDASVLVMKGSYSYTAADGKTYTVNYTADETGFHPEGEHLPK